MNMFNLGEHILYLANKNKGYIRNNIMQFIKAAQKHLTLPILNKGQNQYKENIFISKFKITRKG